MINSRHKNRGIDLLKNESQKKREYLDQPGPPCCLEFFVLVEVASQLTGFMAPDLPKILIVNAHVLTVGSCSAGGSVNAY